VNGGWLALGASAGLALAAGVPRGAAARLAAPIRRQVVPLQRASVQVFTCDTAFGDCDPERPSKGHCLLAAMALQDLVGGSIRTGTVQGTPHYWNRVGPFEVDLTADQFGFKAPRWRRGRLYAGTRFPREAGEALAPVGQNETVNGLYRRFRRRLVPLLRGAGLAGAAKTLSRPLTVLSR
jgi:hypothetical protein